MLKNLEIRRKKKKTFLPVPTPSQPSGILGLEEAKKKIIRTGYKVVSKKTHPDIGGIKPSKGELKVLPEVIKKKTEDFKTLGAAQEELLGDLKKSKTPQKVIDVDDDVGTTYGLSRYGYKYIVED